MSEPTAYDFMVGLLVVIQDMKQRTNKLKEEGNRLTKKFESLKDAKNIDASALYTNLEGVVSDYDLADLHLGFAENKVNNIMERLMKKKLGGTES